MTNTFTLPAGIYPPLPTFFDARDELDLATFRRHIQYLSGTGIAGYVVMGSNGEAVHLSPDERTLLIETARASVDENVPILAGCGEQSTRTTVANCHLAANAGANFSLILPPFYFKSRMDSHALLSHYRSIADSSPLPIVIYNMPANTAGIDLDAALICALAEHPNIIGVKDSAGNMAKLAQIVDKAPAHFRVFAGSEYFPPRGLSVAGTLHCRTARRGSTLTGASCPCQYRCDGNL